MNKAKSASKVFIFKISSCRLTRIDFLAKVRTRKVYRITPTGEQGFLDWLRQPIITMRKMRVEFPTLYFFRTLGLEGVDGLITTRGIFCREPVERLEQKAAIGWLHDCREKA